MLPVENGKVKKRRSAGDLSFLAESYFWMETRPNKKERPASPRAVRHRQGGGGLTEKP
jgi:hypothetical protein